MKTAIRYYSKFVYLMKKLLFFATALMLLMAPMGAKAQQGVQNYVSASGYVIFNAPFCNTDTDGYAFDFENDYVEGHLVDWTTIDADGDTYNWTLSPNGEGYGCNGSNGVVMSYSYNNYSGALNPDNYLVSPKLAITANNHYVTFFACALDESYPADHFGLAVSTTGTNTTDFVMLQEWTMTAKQGDWHEYVVDLGNYVGQEVYIAIRHFNSQDNFCLCVDNIFVGYWSHDPLVNCSIALDGTTVANNITGAQYLLDTDGFANNSSHTTTITATYQSGAILTKTTDWVFRTADNFLGSPTGLQAESDGNQVQLSWTLPTMSAPIPVEELYYDFSDSTLMDLTLIDANNDGQNFRVYPYGGYGGGIGLRSWSWMSGANNLNPDNYLVTPRLIATENARISFMACDADMPGIAPDPEHFGVAVSTSGNTNPNDFVMVAEWNSTGTYTEYTADLSAYAGQQIYVAIRHFNTTGECYFLCVDDIKVTGVEAEVTRNAIGALVYADGELIALLNHGETSFTHEVNRYNSEYCIRIIQDGSRETGDYYALAAPQCADAELNCLAPKNLAAEYDGDKVTISWEREIFIDFENDPQGWSFLDADGDGSVFGIYAAGGMNPDGSVNTEGTNASLASFSYLNGYGALQPDNYAFMPKIKVMENAKMAFYAAGFDPSYSTEHFGVAVASSDGTQVTTITEYDSRNPYQRYEVDLSAYTGQEIYLGFRHFTNVANYALCIDNITVTNAVWAGTTSVTYEYNVYRSANGQNYDLIGVVTGSAMHFDDHDTSMETCYYQVTAINTIVGGDCESAPAMAVDGIHDYVTVHTDGVNEQDTDLRIYPNPTHGQVTIEAEGLNRVTVINALGQTVYEAPANANQMVLNLSQYGTGMYLIRISSETGVSVKRVSVVK
jgi:hypothetical protein